MTLVVNTAGSARSPKSIPMVFPSSQPILEDLKDRRPNVMFCVKPWYRDILVEGGLPFEAAVRHHFHAEERHWKTGEVVVVYARVNEGSRKADLSIVLVVILVCYLYRCTHLANVIFHGEFRCPQWRRWPALAIDAVIGHTGIDVVLDVGLLRRISQRLANGHLIAPCEGIDKGSVGAGEQSCYEFLIIEGACEDGDIFETCELLCNRK